jgi:hypothetical protein
MTSEGGLMRSRVSRLAVMVALLTTLVLVSAAPVSAGNGNLGKVYAVPKSLNFGQVAVYQQSDGMTVWMYNNTKASLWLVDWRFDGNDPNDFSGDLGTPNDCYWLGFYQVPLEPGQSCGWVLSFTPGDAGKRSAYLRNVWYDGARFFLSTVNLRGWGYWD